MSIHYRNPQTGKYEAIKIPVMKGEQGHAGIHVGTDAPPTTDIKLWFDPSDTSNDVDLANRLETTLTACHDYMGNDQGSIKGAADANVEYLLREVNTTRHEGTSIAATDTYSKQVNSAFLKGVTKYKNIDGQFYEDFNIFANCKKLANQNLSSDGELMQSAIRKVVDYIAVDDDSVVKINDLKIKNLVFYDESKTKLAVVTVDSSSEYTLNIPKGARYFRFSYDSTLPTEKASITLSTLEIVSVKNPVSKSASKNLCNNSTLRYDAYLDNNGNVSTVYQDIFSDFFLVDASKPIYVSTWHNSNVLTSYQFYWVVEYDAKKKFISKTRNYYPNGAFALNPLTKYVRINLGGELPPQYTHKKEVQLMVTYEKSNKYVAHNSHTLTTPSDLELRGLGSTKDTLNLMTGEVVSKFEYLNFQDCNFKIEDVVTSSDTGYSRLWIRIKTDAINNHSRINMYYANNLFRSFSTEYHAHNAPCECISYRANGSGMNIILKTNRVESPTIENFKRWLENNMTPILYDLKPQYYLSKFIDLKGQKLYSYDEVTHYTCTSKENHPAPILSIGIPTNLSAMVTKQKTMIQNLEKENQTLSNELQLSILSSNEVDNDLLAQSFELDFRLMEVESALNLPMAATFQLGGKAMAMTPYDMAKKLILAGNYKRSDMERKLNVYVSKKRMTEVERQELIQLMNEAEGIVAIEPEAEELVTEHEAVTIPLH